MRFIFNLFNSLYKKDILSIYIPLYNLYKFLSDYKDIQEFKKKIAIGQTVIDGGANIGFYTRLFSKLTGDSGRVIAFEPDEKNFSILKNRTSHLKNVIIVKAALADKSGSLDFFLSEELNVDHQAYDSGEGRKKITVKAYSLDDYVKEFKLAKVDFIKTDLQGFDPIAIRGMKNTIANNSDLVMHCEFWPFGMLKAGIDPEKWLNELKNSSLITTFLYKENKDEKYYTSIWLKKSK